MKVPFVDLRNQYLTIKNEIDEAIHRVLDSSAFILGEEVRRFETEFSEYVGCAHTIAVANGTDAIVLALKAVDVQPGDRVIVPANTFIATAEAVTAIGAIVELVDVDPDTLLISPMEIRKKLAELAANGHTCKAIIPVHLYGNYCDMPDIRKIADDFELKIIEDASQAHGADLNNFPVGHWGDAATFSFYPGKNLGAYGDAGAVITNSAEIADKVKMLRNHGRRDGDKYEHRIEGYNSRMDGIQAAVLTVKLKYLEKWTEHRIEMANIYNESLGRHFDLVKKNRGARHVYHLYVIQSNDRDDLAKKLAERGISTGIHYPTPLHKLEAYSSMSKLKFPVTERASGRILSLPIDGDISPDKIHYVIQHLHSVGTAKAHKNAIGPTEIYE